jgi:multidrug efflux pump subunit AcrA (membrane-fusion protein)
VALLSASLAPTERAQLSTVRVDADAQVVRAKVQDEATELALRRAERLLAEDAVGAKVLDDARAQRETARAALAAALTQQAAVAGTVGAAPAPLASSRSTLSQTQLVSPLAGTLREVRVSARQLVLAGAPILEVVDDESAWVRVSVPAGELGSLSPSSAALVDDLSASRPEQAVVAAKAEHAPMTALPQQASVDRYFVLPSKSRFSIGQTVAVWLALQAEEESPTVRAESLLYDPSGGAWVYQRAAEHSFVRRRVEVVRIEDGIAFLSSRSLTPSGLRVGDRIVTSGAMELYGSEFGSGK